MKRLLFICGKCRHRSPTAEHVFSQRTGVEADAAGLNSDADIVLGSDQLEWATEIVVMEKAHASKLRRKYRKHINGKRIIILDIPDKYVHMQPELINLLETRMRRVT